MHHARYGFAVVSAPDLGVVLYSCCVDVYYQQANTDDTAIERLCSTASTVQHTIAYNVLKTHVKTNV